MFEKLEKDTEKVINDSKSGTRFFGSYSNEYRTETYTNEKGKKRNRRVYIGDDYIIDDEKYKQKLVLILVLNLAEHMLVKIIIMLINFYILMLVDFII